MNQALANLTRHKGPDVEGPDVEDSAGLPSPVHCEVVVQEMGLSRGTAATDRGRGNGWRSAEQSVRDCRYVGVGRPVRSAPTVVQPEILATHEDRDHGRLPRSDNRSSSGVYLLLGGDGHSTLGRGLRQRETLTRPKLLTNASRHAVPFPARPDPLHWLPAELTRTSRRGVEFHSAASRPWLQRNHS